MKLVLKFRWAVLALWLAATAGLMMSAPDMQQLVHDKGQINIPDGYPSMVAGEMIAEMEAQAEAQAEEGGGPSLSSVLVFHRESGLTPSDMDEIERALQKLAEDETAGVTSVTSHYTMPELRSQMVSADGRTVLALVSADSQGRVPAEVRQALEDAVSGVPVEHYYTGGWLISEDVVQSSEEGLKKTEGITVVFILVILLVVFRSAIAPFIPLLTVGLTYLVSQSLVGFLVEYVDFPLSTFTQIFLVAVLFGIGTDYCILLISRFKEELAKRGEDRKEAVLATYRTAGKTVLVSGLAVLVGFACIGLSTFVLYRSAVAVAVGIAVLLIALFTILPFFMMTLGGKLFWPIRGSLEHRESRLWGAVGKFSLRRPVWALLVIAAVTVPFLAAYEGKTSFDSMDEIGSKYESVKAFEIISDSFGPGDSLPSTVVVRAPEGRAFDTPEGLAAIESITRELSQVDGVKMVRSATRPTGELLEDFQVTNQVEQLGEGLGQGEEGLSRIGDGLAEAGAALSDNAPKLNEAAAGARQLTAGTLELKSGVEELGAGLERIAAGLRDGTAGAAALAAGMEEAQASAERLAQAGEELLAGYGQLDEGLTQLASAYEQTAAKQQELAQGLADLGVGLGGLAEKYPELRSDPDFQRAQGAVAQLQAGAEELGGGLRELNAQLAGAAQGLQQANAGYAQAVDGQKQLTGGLRQLAAGLAELRAGIAQAADGQGQIVARLPEVTGGMAELAAGQRELSEGFSSLTGQLAELTDGLQQSVDGLSQVTGGLDSAQAYLSRLAAAPDPRLSGWYLPEEALEDEGFRLALDTYVSAERDLTRLDVVFSGNPYAIGTLEKTDDLLDAVGRALQGTAYAGAVSAVDGVTSMNNDLRNISADDYSRTVVLMLIGIGLILIVVFRSIVMPLYLVLSLGLTFYTSMAIAEVIYVRLLGLSGISWAVPFFGFVMLIALGIDYSIFLMDRFKENRDRPPQEAILDAMKHMGTVIMSAAVILGGTFAAMLPSGVMSLMQIATIVLCGLLLYALVMLPLFIPVMVRLFGEANWWPFMKKERSAAAERTSADGRAGGLVQNLHDA